MKKLEVKTKKIKTCKVSKEFFEDYLNFIKDEFDKQPFFEINNVKYLTISSYVLDYIYERDDEGDYKIEKMEELEQIIKIIKELKYNEDLLLYYND